MTSTDATPLTSTSFSYINDSSKHQSRSLCVDHLVRTHKSTPMTVQILMLAQCSLCSVCVRTMLPTHTNQPNERRFKFGRHEGLRTERHVRRSNSYRAPALRRPALYRLSTALVSGIAFLTAFRNCCGAYQSHVECFADGEFCEAHVWCEFVSTLSVEEFAYCTLCRVHAKIKFLAVALNEGREGIFRIESLLAFCRRFFHARSESSEIRCAWTISICPDC